MALDMGVGREWGWGEDQPPACTVGRAEPAPRDSSLGDTAGPCAPHRRPSGVPGTQLREAQGSVISRNSLKPPHSKAQNAWPGRAW